MDFFKNKIKKYQEKKLDEILFKIQFHQSTKNELEEKMNKMNDSLMIPLLKIFHIMVKW